MISATLPTSGQSKSRFFYREKVPLKMDNLCKEILYKITEYLEIKEKLRFFTVNKNLYLASNSDDLFWMKQSRFYLIDATNKTDFLNNLKKYKNCLDEYVIIKKLSIRLKNWLHLNSPIIEKTLKPPLDYIENIEINSRSGHLYLFFNCFSMGQKSPPGLFGSYEVYDDNCTFLLSETNPDYIVTMFNGLNYEHNYFLAPTRVSKQLNNFKSNQHQQVFIVGSQGKIFKRGTFIEFLTNYVNDLENNRFDVHDDGSISIFPNYGPYTIQSPITNGIQVFISSTPCLNPSLNVLYYYYRVKIKFFDNHVKFKSCQLLRRFWVITFNSGAVQTVSGEGVLGETPKFTKSKSTHAYNSCCGPNISGGHLDLPLSMEGSFTFVDNDLLEIFQVPIPKCLFEQPLLIL